MIKTQKNKKLYVIIGVVAMSVFITSCILFQKQPNVNSSKDTHIEKKRVQDTDFDTTNTVEENFNKLRTYIRDTTIYQIDTSTTGFTDELNHHDLELLKLFENKGYIIKGDTLFVPTEYSEGTIYYEFELGTDKIDERIKVTAEFNVETEQLLSLTYDTDINEV